MNIKQNGKYIINISSLDKDSNIHIGSEFFPVKATLDSEDFEDDLDNQSTIHIGDTYHLKCKKKKK